MEFSTRGLKPRQAKFQIWSFLGFKVEDPYATYQVGGLWEELLGSTAGLWEELLRSTSSLWEELLGSTFSSLWEELFGSTSGLWDEL